MLLLSHFHPPSPYPASHRDRLYVTLMDAAPVVKWHLYITVIPADNYIATLPVNDGHRERRQQDSVVQHVVSVTGMMGTQGTTITR